MGRGEYLKNKGLYFDSSYNPNLNFLICDKSNSKFLNLNKFSIIWAFKCTKNNRYNSFFSSAILDRGMFIESDMKTFTTQINGNRIHCYTTITNFMDINLYEYQFDNGNCNLYINGSKCFSGYQSSSPCSLINPSNPSSAYFGNWYGAGSPNKNGIFGYLYCFRIYDYIHHIKNYNINYPFKNIEYCNNKYKE